VINQQMLEFATHNINTTLYLTSQNNTSLESKTKAFKNVE